MVETILATGGYDEKVVLWNAKSEIATRIIPLKDVHVNCLSVTQDRQYLAVAAHKSLKLFDLNSNSTTPIHTYEGHTGNITSLGFSKKSNWIYTGSEDGCIRIWDFNTQKSQRCYERSSGVNTVALHPNQSELVSGYENGLLCLWDLASNSYRAGIKQDDTIRSVQIAGDASFGVSANNSGVVSLWNLTGEGFNFQGRVQAHNTYITKCVLSTEAKLLATCSADKTVKIWTVNPGASDVLLLDKALIGHKMWVWDAAFTVERSFIATCSTDGTAKLWEVSTGRITKNYVGVHTKGVVSLVLNDYN
jgi:target of rapamycin complex subunit LST8